jgi:TRAP-type mannitol/chloroaromatic compound transport system permease small subunit
MNDNTESPAGQSLLGRLDRGLCWIEWVTAVIAGVVIFFVMFVGVAEIFLRKLFNSPLYGQLDLIELTICAYALLTISYCWRMSGHIRVDLVIDRFHGRTRWVIELMTTVMALALITALLPGIFHFFQNALEIGDSTINTRWPTWPSKFVPVIGFTLLWFRLVLECWGYIRLILHPDADPVAIPARSAHELAELQQSASEDTSPHAP